MGESEQRKDPSQLQVRDYMTPNPETLDSAQSLLEAVLLLRKSGFRHIPILEDGRLAGAFTDRDLLRLSPSMLVPTSQQHYNSLFEKPPLGKIMSRNPLTIGPDGLLAQAVGL